MATEIASTPRTRRSARRIPRSVEKRCESTMSADCCCAALIGPRWWRPSAPSWPQAGANIGSPDQHAAEQSSGTFMQRTIFHLQGLTTARDALEGNFRGAGCRAVQHVFRAHRGTQPRQWRSLRPMTTTAYRTCCGATVAVNWI
jgi:hypothetical protein